MEIVINIDDKLYNRIKYLEPKADTMLDELMRSIQSGTPLPEHTAIIALEHELQTSNWVEELKDYREHEFCRHCEERDTYIFDEPCKSCKIHFVKRRETNTDEDSN